MYSIKKILERFAQCILKFPVHILICSLGIFIVSIYFAQKIHLNSSLDGLLDEENSVSKTLKESNEIFDHKDIAIIFIRSNSFKEGQAFVKKTADELKKHPELKEVYYELSDNFFTKNILLYFELTDLKKIYYRIKQKINYEKKKFRVGLLLDDLVEDDPGLAYQDIFEKYKKKQNFNFSNSEASFFYKKKSNTQGKLGKHIFIIMARPNQSALNIAYSSKIMSDISTIMKKHKPDFPDIQSIEFTGRYQKKPESFKSLIDNFKRVTLISVLGVLLVLFFFFRSFWPIVLLLSGLIYGVVLTIGLAQIFIGNLNLISAFLVAILLGLGIDFGIHIILRYKEERNAGKTVREAFILMYTQTCLASIMAALTTSIVFATLMFSNFTAFKDFGFIGCFGILCILFSYMTLLPAMLLTLTHHLKIRIIISPMKFYLPSVIWKRKKIILYTCSILTLVCAFGFTKLEFNYDFSRILGEKNLPSYVLGKEVNELFGKSFDVPSLIIVKNLDQEKNILQQLQKSSEEGSETPIISFAIGKSSFLPQNQKNKLNIIRNIRNLIDNNQKYFNQLNKKQIKKMKQFKKSLYPIMFTTNQLPNYVKNVFSTKKPNESRRMILIYSNINEEDGKEIIQFADYITKLQIDAQPIQVASQSLVFAEILKIVHSEGKMILAIALLTIFLLVIINLQSLPQGLLVFFPLMLGLVWMIGIQALLGLKSDFVNIITYLIILGTSIDATLHLYHRFKKSRDLYVTMRHTGEAITISSLTTFIGFGSLIFGRNESIVDLGLLSIIGIITNYLSCMLVLPVMIQFKLKKLNNHT